MPKSFSIPDLEAAGFTRHQLVDGSDFITGCLPEDLKLSAEQFDELWRLHPPEYHRIRMRGRLVETPRWQQAYGADYYYTGRVNHSLPTPPMLQALLEWTQARIEPRFNGILLNWYDGALRH